MPEKFCPLSVFYREIQLVADACSGQTIADDAARSLSSLVLEQGNCLVDAQQATNTYIIRAAVQVNDIGSSERLAALVASLARLPDVKNNTDGVIQYNDGIRDWNIKPGDTITFYDGRLWVSLPNFGLRMRDLWNGPQSLMGIAPSAEEVREVRDQWTSLNSFCAHLVEYGDEIERLAYYRHYGLWTMVDALEYGFKSRQGKYLRLNIPAAAKWVEVFGLEMRKWDDYDNPPCAVGGTVWNDDERGSRLSAERWSFWRERFRRLSTHKELKKDLQRVSAEAAERMG